MLDVRTSIYVFVAFWFAIVGYGSTAHANSCGNVNVIGTYDQSGLRDNEYGLYAAGTFRMLAGEEDEGKQPMFNLAEVNCTSQLGDRGNASLVCKVTKAVVWAESSKPDTDSPNCSLDLDTSEYSMKELQKGILTGMESSLGGGTGCYNSMLTIDRNAKRVYLSFTKTQYADRYDSIKANTCGKVPQTEVLMNCTGWPRTRKNGQTPPRYCDFSGSSDK